MTTSSIASNNVSKNRLYLSKFISTFILSLFVLLSGCDSVIDAPDTRQNLNNNPAFAEGNSTEEQSSDYTITLLPEGVQSSTVNNYITIDDQGNIFGAILEDGNGTKRAVKWIADAKGSISNPELLGFLPAPFDNANQTTQDANGNNEATGYAENTEGTRVAWLWTNGSMMLLPAPELNHVGFGAFGLNDAGMVVGQVLESVATDSIISHGIAWVPPYTDPILLPRDESYGMNGARSINNNGIITGFLRSSGLDDAAVEWQIDVAGTVVSGPDKLSNTEGLLVSNSNETLDIAGLGSSNAKLYRSDSNQLIDLQMLADDSRSRARDVNERGTDGSLQVVGESDDWSFDSYNAVLWTISSDGKVSGPSDLGIPQSVTNGPPSQRVSYIGAGSYSLNNNGWIVGWTMESNGTLHGTLWQPKQDEGGDGSTGSGPTASFSYTCDNTNTCLFTDTSTSGDSDIIEWSWQSDEGHTASTQNTTFTFESAGDFTVSLTVTDANGLSDSVTQTLSCSSHPKFGLRCN